MPNIHFAKLSEPEVYHGLVRALHTPPLCKQYTLQYSDTPPNRRKKVRPSSVCFCIWPLPHRTVQCYMVFIPFGGIILAYTENKKLWLLSLERHKFRVVSMCVSSPNGPWFTHTQRRTTFTLARCSFVACFLHVNHLLNLCGHAGVACRRKATERCTSFVSAKWIHGLCCVAQQKKKKTIGTCRCDNIKSYRLLVLK